MKYSALVIRADRNKPLGELFAIARAEAKKKSGLKGGRVEVHELIYLSRIDIHVAVYCIPDVRDERVEKNF